MRSNRECFQQASGPRWLSLPLLAATRAPKLNLIETLWGQAKDVVSVNQQYASINEQAERFGSVLVCELRPCPGRLVGKPELSGQRRGDF